ncbi:hypothetical protein [Ralstonia sp. 1B3]|uniref:hypothetical protein n=1 Tax=Ralstonia sp. 1B3 TaxID=2997421 RepID=UPI0028F5D1BE|nr:hypothetical protein LMG19089_03563 [Ralstonia sp. LMG 6871]CAJ0716733.1 hypothetical protein LMG6871_01893 [Ralstonia sp. LMG 6871]
MSAGPPGPAAALVPDESMLPPGSRGPAGGFVVCGEGDCGAEAGMVSGYRDKECFAVFASPG